MQVAGFKYQFNQTSYRVHDTGAYNQLAGVFGAAQHFEVIPCSDTCWYAQFQSVHTAQPRAASSSPTENIRSVP